MKANRIFNNGQKAKIKRLFQKAKFKSQFQKTISKIKRQGQHNYYAIIQQSETPL